MRRVGIYSFDRSFGKRFFSVGLCSNHSVRCARIARSIESGTFRTRNAARAERARRTTAEAASELGLGAGSLGEGDYLLGWQGVPGAWRYCHSFTEGEARDLAAAALERAGLNAQTQTFEADGRNGRLNRYLLFKLR